MINEFKWLNAFMGSTMNEADSTVVACVVGAAVVGAVQMLQVSGQAEETDLEWQLFFQFLQAV